MFRRGSQRVDRLVSRKAYQPYQAYQCRSGAVRLVSWYGLSRTGDIVGERFIEGVLVRLKPYRV